MIANSGAFCFSLFLVIVLLFPEEICAHPEYGQETGKTCMHCHFSPTGGGALNEAGKNYTPAKKLDSGSSGTTTSGGDSSSATTGQNSVQRMQIKPRKNPAKSADKDLKRLTEIERAEIINRKKLARRTWKATVLKGKKYFYEPGILGSGVQRCADCHTSSKLAGKVGDFPRWDEALSEVITFDRKMRYCIFKRMNGKPLAAEDPVTVSLASFFKEVSRGKGK